MTRRTIFFVAPCLLLAIALACGPRKKACPAGFDDCDPKKEGCETKVDDDVNNCGLCGNDCNATNGKPSCRAGKCAIACNDGWGNCDDNNYNGCETDLTATKSCGKCGNDCGTGYCRGGRCFKPVVVSERVAIGPSPVLSFDGERVYWAGNEALYAAPVVGGDPERVREVKNARGVAWDEKFVYWADGTGIFKQRHKGGPPFGAVRLATASIVAMTIDDAFVYWTEATRVMKAPLGGGKEIVVAERQVEPRGIAVTNDEIYWANYGTTKRGFDDSAIYHAPKRGGEPLLVVKDYAPRALATDGKSLYWSNEKEIRRAPIAGGTPAVLFSSDDEVRAIGISGAHLFWITKDKNGTLSKVEK